MSLWKRRHPAGYCGGRFQRQPGRMDGCLHQLRVRALQMHVADAGKESLGTRRNSAVVPCLDVQPATVSCSKRRTPTQLHLEYFPRRATIRERHFSRSLSPAASRTAASKSLSALERCYVSRPLCLSWLRSLGSVSGTVCLCHGSPFPGCFLTVRCLLQERHGAKVRRGQGPMIRPMI